MGVPDLWGVLAPGFDERVSLPVFVSRFVQHHGRPPKLAIDGFMLLFQSRHSAGEEGNEVQSIINNFISKLCYLSSLNITYVVVLDGPNHPRKIRHDAGLDAESSSLEYLGIERSLDGDIIYQVKKTMHKYLIQFFQSPGEAEAECAVMQKDGIVDYVLSNDVDSLVFGATKVLRNFSKWLDDKPSSLVLQNSPKQEFYVTPVNMERVKSKTGLEVNRLVFIATMRGGDYSEGIKMFGITRAVRLALSGTQFATFYTRSPTKAESKIQRRMDPPPDFSNLLIECFIDPVTGDRIQIVQRQGKLQRFIKLLNSTIAERSRDIFGRMAQIGEIFIDESIVIAYLFPNVSSKRFIFKADFFSSGSSCLFPNDVYIHPKNLLLKLIQSKLLTVELTAMKTINGETFVRVKYNLLLLKKLSKMKSDNDIGSSLFVKNSSEQESSSEDEEIRIEKESKSIFQTVWMPKSLIQMVDFKLVENFKTNNKRRQSPKLKTQKTTLDTLMKLQNNVHLPPLVDSSCTKTLGNDLPPNSISNKPISENENEKLHLSNSLKMKQVFENIGNSSDKPSEKKLPNSPTKSRKRSIRKKLLPGQSFITTFFQKPPQTKTESDLVESSSIKSNFTEENPFLSPTLDSDSATTTEDVISSLSLSTKTTLLYQNPSKRSVSAGSAETSPTKKLHMQLSPNSSPYKLEKFPENDIMISPSKNFRHL